MNTKALRKTTTELTVTLKIYTENQLLVNSVFCNDSNSKLVTVYEAFEINPAAGKVCNKVFLSRKLKTHIYSYTANCFRTFPEYINFLSFLPLWPRRGLPIRMRMMFMPIFTLNNCKSVNGKFSQFKTRRGRGRQQFHFKSAAIVFIFSLTFFPSEIKNGQSPDGLGVL